MTDTDPACATRPEAWNGTLARTRFFDALSLLLPAGETFVIETLETWRANGAHPLPEATRAEFDRLIAEERAHQRAHRVYNDALIAATPSAALLEQRAIRATGELRAFGLRGRVALAAAFEQLTAVLSLEVLHHAHLLRAADPVGRQARMWRWHAKEEIAHCHVMADVADAAGVGPLRRVAALCLATGYLALDVLRMWAVLSRADVRSGACRPARLLADAAHFAWRSAPSLLRLAGGWLRCMILPYRAAHAG